MAAETSLFLIGPRGGGRPLVETLTGMLANTRHYLLRASRDLTAEQLDAPCPPAPNGIGMILSHLIAAETMFQNMTFRGFQFGDEEQRTLAPGFRFQRNPLAGQGIDAYHRRLAEVREATLGLFSQVDDAWLATPRTFFGQPANLHYYWFHYLQDEARHTGQIILLRKHLLPDGDAGFNPYALG